MSDHAPIQFSQLGLQADRFKLASLSKQEWAGPCPFCGGEDRFRIFTDHQFPSWNGWCRECRWTGWADQLDPSLKRELSAEEKRQFAIRQAEHEAARARATQERAIEIDRLLAKFTSEEIWSAYARRMGDEQRAWWRGQGIPDDWQTYLRLGYTEDRAYRVGDDLRHSPAYTIPYFGPDFTFKTMQYRLCSPDNPADRYRFERGLGAAYYMTSPTEPLADVILICEGAKKAIVTRLHIEKVTVLAVPSKSTWRNTGILEAVKGAGRVYILLDPDAGKEAREMRQAIGKAARVVSLFDKVDDCFMNYGLTAGQFAGYLRQAI